MQTVKSQRITRGTYAADQAHPALIRPVTETRERQLTTEIASLKALLADTVKQGEAATQIQVKAAYDIGFAEGRKQGYADAHTPLDQAAADMRTLLKELEAGLAVVWERSRTMVVKLSLDIARKVIGEAAQSYEPLAGELAGRCLQLIRDQAQVTIAVNPDDAAKLREMRTELLSLTEGIKNIEIVERASVSKGGVVVESDAGQLDARLEEQLSVLETSLLPDWSKPSGGN